MKCQRNTVALRFVLPLFIGLVLISGSTPAWAESPPTLPVEPEPAPVTPENPKEAHPTEHGGRAQGTEPFPMSFHEAVEATAAEQAPEGLQFHVQGQFLQETLDGSGTGADLAEEEVITPSLPTLEDTGTDEGAATPGEFVTEFAGIDHTNWIPPDTIIGVGPDHILEAVNVGFSVYSKEGNELQGYTTFGNFFSPVLPSGWDGKMFDPRVVYWPGSGGHYVLLALGIDTTDQESYFFIGVSQTTDPTGNWWAYRFSNTFANSGDSDAWLDYCGLGADSFGLYVTCNLFNWTGGFKHAKLMTLNPDMYSGGSSNGWGFWNLKWNGGALAGSLQPAYAYSTASGDETFFVNTFSGSGNEILLWELTGDRTSSPSLTRSTISTPAYNAIGQNVDQPGSSTDIDGGDARVMNAAYMNRKVYAVLTDDTDNDGSRAGWLLSKLDVDSTSRDWGHNLTGPDGFYYFYPAITLDGTDLSDPHLAVYGSWTDAETTTTSTTQYASGLLKVYDDQPNSGSGSFRSIEAGDDSYVLLDSNNRNRWGDYSGAHFDFASKTVWGGVEVAWTSNRWRTWIHSIGIGDGCTQDIYEDDDTSGSASPISSGDIDGHSICPSGDADWATFTLTDKSAVTIETNGPSGDTVMYLYDSSLSLLETDDDGGTSLFSLIDRTCGTDGLPADTYYVRVIEFGDDHEIGSYNLSYTIDEQCPVCPTNLQLSDTTISGTETFTADETITLGPNLTVNGDAIDVIAGTDVIFNDGTEIGGSFAATVDSNPCSLAPEESEQALPLSDER